MQIERREPPQIRRARKTKYAHLVARVKSAPAGEWVPIPFAELPSLLVPGRKQNALHKAAKREGLRLNATVKGDVILARVSPNPEKRRDRGNCAGAS